MIKLITEHKDYLLLVDTVNSLLKDEVCLELNTLLIKIFQKEEYMKPCVKIIAASHKLGDLPLLPELSKQEEDAKQVALNLYPLTGQSVNNINRERRLAFIEGYKTASKKWSDEDMKAAYEQGWSDYKSGLECIPLNPRDPYMQKSLSPILTPIGFEPEYEFLDDDLVEGDSTKVLKIVNGVLQGTYKFKV